MIPALGAISPNSIGYLAIAGMLVWLAWTGRRDLFLPALAASGVIMATTWLRPVDALAIAVFRNHEDVVELLVRRGAKLDAKDKFGNTPLMIAAIHGHAGAAKTLLSGGADPNCAGPEGITPLMLAAMKGHLQVCRELTRSGADLDARTTRGYTAWHAARDEGRAAIVSLLTHAGSKAARPSCARPISGVAID